MVVLSSGFGSPRIATNVREFLWGSLAKTGRWAYRSSLTFAVQIVRDLYHTQLFLPSDPFAQLKSSAHACGHGLNHFPWIFVRHVSVTDHSIYRTILVIPGKRKGTYRVG